MKALGKKMHGEETTYNNIHKDGHSESVTDPAQRAGSVKIIVQHAV